MRNLHYSPKESLDAPWLLSSKSLKELDTTINEYWEKFEWRRAKRLRRDINDFKKKFTKVQKERAEIDEDYHKELDNRINEHKERSIWSKSTRSLEIDLRDNTVCSYTNFDEAFRDRYLLDKRPIGFHITLLSGNIEFYMTVDSSGMNFQIEPPKDVPEVQELYTTVYEWAMEIRRHARVQEIWGKVAKHRWKILILGLLAGLLLLFLFPYTSSISDTINIQQQLFNLYDQGITSTNVIDAVNLLVLLRKVQQITIIPNNPWLITYLGILAYLIIALFIRPKAELDIGKGRDAIQRWRLWQWMVLLPVVFIMGDVLRPYVAEIVKRFFSLVP